MNVNRLQPESFAAYQPEARQLAQTHLALLQQMPISFLPLLLREVIGYDWKFPAERRELDQQFAFLQALSPEALKQQMAPFAQLQLTEQLENSDWVNSPELFSEQLSAHLWATHQIDAFRKAAIDYVHQMNAAAKPSPLPVNRIAIAVIGQGVPQAQYRLFRKLRPMGVYFKQVDPTNGYNTLLDFISERAKAHPVPFGHWYIDGGKIEAVRNPELTYISYGSLAPVRLELLSQMEKAMQSGTGSEALRSMLAQMQPSQLKMNDTGTDRVLNRFQISLLTEGSGTQLFSTTFVQWGAREALRRAQPLTLLTRYAPRQRDRLATEAFSPKSQDVSFDPHGSLIDGDMGAYYTWINQQRLTGAEKATFLAWFEGHNEAVAVAPSLKRGTESDEKVTLKTLLARLT
jgi:hypothetical protein